MRYLLLLCLGLTGALPDIAPFIPALFDHCFIALNDTHYLSFGGKELWNSQSSFTDSYYSSYSYSLPMILNSTDVFHWTNVSSENGDTIFPISLTGASAHALTNTSIVVLFGKEPSSSSSFDRIFLFDHLNGVSETLETKSTPEPRHHHLSFYNSSNNRLFLTGGILNSAGEIQIDTSFGQIGTLDSNMYYIDLSVTLPDQEFAVKNSTSSRIEVSATSWTKIEPPASLSLMQAGLAASSGVIAGNFILYCFGSSSNIPSNKCTIFDTVLMKYVQPVYNDIENLPDAREGAEMV
jgi:hypothetical protein